jgi:hypothetical protein
MEAARHIIKDVLDRLANTNFLTNMENVPAWMALHKLLSRPWWTWVWVLQEIVMAKQAIFICGEKSITWPVLQLVT